MTGEVAGVLYAELISVVHGHGRPKLSPAHRSLRSRALLHSDETDRIIAAGIEVHRTLGPGFLEQIYEEALALELEARGIPFERQKAIRVRYRGQSVGFYRLDFTVNSKVVLEIKAVEQIHEVHLAVTLAYMKATSLPVGLIMNFAKPTLRVRRLGREGSAMNGESGKRGAGEDVKKTTEPESRLSSDHEVPLDLFAHAVVCAHDERQACAYGRRHRLR
jgi:GxxExxY protein